MTSSSLRARGDQLLGLAQDRVGAAADEVAADRRDDAEGAAVVAALGNLQIAVVARGQLDPRPDVGRGDQVEIGVGDRRRGLVHRVDDRLILLRPGDREHVREARADDVGLIAHAAGHDHAAVLGDGLADRLEAFLLGRIEEAAGVDQHDVGAGIVGRHLIAVCAQLGEDAFAVDQRLGAAERNHADARRGGKLVAMGSAPLSAIMRQKRGARAMRVTGLGKQRLPGVDPAIQCGPEG